MTIKSELLAIRQADPENILRTEEALAWARENKDSALHAALDWDDRRAANAHRIWQIRQLIKIHIVEFDRTPIMVSLSIDRPKGGGYRAISDVVERPDLREVMLNDALADLQRVQDKYNRVQELELVWKEADAVRERTRNRRRVSNRAKVPA